MRMLISACGVLVAGSVMLTGCVRGYHERTVYVDRPAYEPAPRTVYVPAPPPPQPVPVVVAPPQPVIVREVPQERIVIVRNEPPPPLRENVGFRPSPAHIWIPGYWVASGGRWVWVSGRWDLPPRGYTRWDPPRWERRSNIGFEFRIGGWH